MRILSIICLVFFTQSVVAADKKYGVQEIPQPLTTNANAVVRIYNSKVIVKDLSTVTQQVHFVVTILNKNGEQNGVLVCNYDKLTKISGIKGNLYNASGDLLKKLKSSDIKDLSAVDDNNLDDDNRMKVHQFYYNTYPYTVEYTYEINTNHTFLLPPFVPQSSDYLSVQNGEYQIEFPEELQLRFKSFNVPEPESGEVKNRKSLRWELKNQTAFSPRMFRNWRDFQPAVFLAAGNFEMNKQRGNMQSWKSFGAFNYSLIEGKDVLPESMKNKVHDIVSGITDDRKKIELLYDYLQKNTRYISIQLGVGGWIPFDAGYVAKNGFGDCKALVNYMKSLLKEAGINSFYTLVNAGNNNFSKNRVIEDFPSQQFNHVILSVPLQNDTMWLECTSQILPAGYLSGFTTNRKALIIKEDGGYLVSTPQLNIKDNRQNRTTKTIVDDDGSAKIRVETIFTGEKQDNLYGMIKTISPEKIKTFLSNSISLASYDIDNFNYETQVSAIPDIKETLEISATHFATITGKRLFVLPNIFSRTELKLTEDTARKYDFVFENAARDSDYTEIVLPAGYKLESSFAPVSLTTPFAMYESSCTLADGKIIYRRVFEQYPARIPASDQAAVIEFFQEVYKTDRARMVLVKEN